jgi:hypothetical protein
MGYPTTSAEQSDLSIGVSAFTSDFQPQIALNIASHDVTTGINQGIGPRFGMSPMPGHQDQETLAGTALGGLRSTEYLSFGAVKQLQARAHFWGVIPITLGTYADPSTLGKFFVWIVTDNNNTTTLNDPDFLLGSVYSGGFFQHTDKFTAGLPLGFYQYGEYVAHLNYMNPCFYQASFHSDSGYDSLYGTTAVAREKYARFAAISISGKDIPCEWLIGKSTSTPTTTSSGRPNLNVWGASFIVPDHIGYVPSPFNLGYTSPVQTVTFRNIKLNSVGEDGLCWEYRYIDFATSQMAAVSNFNMTSPNFLFSQTPTRNGRADGNQTGRTYANVTDVSVFFPGLTINSSYSAVLWANRNPLAIIFQPWRRSADGKMGCFFDLKNPGLSITGKTTGFPNGLYTEYGNVVSTSFYGWSQIFQPDGANATYLPKLSALAADTVGFARAGAANSGLLRKGNSYEFTYSLYDKSLDYETNVGIPVKFTLDPNGDDYVSLILWTDAFSAGGVPHQTPMIAAAQANPIPVIDSESTYKKIPVNITAYRFYYRQLGSYEWLPAGEIEAARLFGDPCLGRYSVCEQPAPLLPGGQPGGFIDYSPIPDDTYIDVAIFQNRAFWVSKKAIVFSLRNNIFAYPLRNIAACPTGEFRGLTIHMFPGQSEQRGRIILWGSKECYVGTFTGQQQLATVQLGADNSGLYPVDGSDFTLDQWTTFTAFSSRAAVVCEGLIIYWGPQGVFLDNGNQLPDRISLNIEPNLFDLYEATKTDEIFGHYMYKTKEVFWFYRPKGNTTDTHALVYNFRSQQFYICQFPGMLIDSIQDVNIEGTSDTGAWVGPRVVISARSATFGGPALLQRGYFFDMKNRSGDLRPATEMMIKSVAAVVGQAQQRKFTLATGYDGTTLAGLTAGDTIVFHQVQDYTGRTDQPDFVGKIVSVSLPDIVVQLPTELDATKYTAVSLSEINYIPAWTTRFNGISYKILTQYWAPGGLAGWFRWLFLHLQFKVSLLPTISGETFTTTYKTPITGTSQANTISFVDNSDGNFQVQTPLIQDSQAAEGQGLKMDVSGVHIANQWTLQYISAKIIPLDGDNLQTFEA